MERYNNVVRILRPFNFSFLFGARARARPINRVSNYCGIFLYISTRIRNNPPDLLQNTNTGFLSIIRAIHSNKMFFLKIAIAEESRHRVIVPCIIVDYTQNDICLK